MSYPRYGYLGRVFFLVADWSDSSSEVMVPSPSRVPNTTREHQTAHHDGQQRSSQRGRWCAETPMLCSLSPCLIEEVLSLRRHIVLFPELSMHMVQVVTVS